MNQAQPSQAPTDDSKVAELVQMLTQSAETLEKTEVKMNEKDKLIEQLQAQIKQKDAELGKTEEMFKEYAEWRGKLETIETRMKDEA